MVQTAITTWNTKAATNNQKFLRQTSSTCVALQQKHWITFHIEGHRNVDSNCKDRNVLNALMRLFMYLCLSQVNTDAGVEVEHNFHKNDCAGKFWVRNLQRRQCDDMSDLSFGVDICFYRSKSSSTYCTCAWIYCLLKSSFHLNTENESTTIRQMLNQPALTKWHTPSHEIRLVKHSTVTFNQACQRL